MISYHTEDIKKLVDSIPEDIDWTELERSVQ